MGYQTTHEQYILITRRIRGQDVDM